MENCHFPLQMRARFLSETLARPQFALMKQSMLRNARHPMKLKDIRGPSAELSRRVEELQRSALNDEPLRRRQQGLPSLEAANRPIFDLLIQVGAGCVIFL